MRIKEENYLKEGLVGAGSQFHSQTFGCFTDDRLILDSGTDDNAFQLGEGESDVSDELIHVRDFIVANFEAITKAKNSHRRHWSDSFRIIGAECSSVHGKVGQILQGGQLSSEVIQWDQMTLEYEPMCKLME